MNSVTMEIDGKTVTAPEGMMLRRAASQAGIDIPGLCDHELLKPSGACRMCRVEIAKGKRRRLVASCCYPVEEGLVVTTSNPKIEKIRKLIIELMWPAWVRLGKQYGITKSRFVPELTDCSLCGLCVRYCAEIKKSNLLFLKGRGIDRRPALVEGSTLACGNCGECFSMCASGWVVASRS